MVGYASIPSIKTQISTSWLPAEGTSITPSQFEFAVAAGSPKSVAAYAIASDLVLKQTSIASQNCIFQQMAQATAAKLYAGLINGSGASGQATGILQTAGIASVSGSSLAYTGILDLIEDIEDVSGIVKPSRVSFLLAPNAARFYGRERRRPAEAS